MAKTPARARRIYEAGVAVYKGSPPASADKILKAMALMLDEATKPKKSIKQSDKGRPQKLPFSPQALYEECLARVPHIVACEPYDKRWFGRLGKVLQASSGLTAGDMETLVAWIEGGGLDFGDSWSFEHIIKHFPNWMTRARGGVTQQASTGPEGFME